MLPFADDGFRITSGLCSCARPWVSAKHAGLGLKNLSLMENRLVRSK